jgi:hypothetical protein
MLATAGTQRSVSTSLLVCAGLGLFIDGEVPVGSVVAVLPGVIYTSTQLTRMPNYPKVCCMAVAI